MIVSDLIDVLRRIDGNSLSQSEREALRDFLTSLVPLQDMDLDSFFSLLRPKKRRAARASGAQNSKPVQAAMSASQIASSLKAVLEDDVAFDQTLQGIAGTKSITVSTLKDAFAELFGRRGNFRSKATRHDVVRKILSERNVAVRDAKMAAMLGRKTAHAE